MADYQITPNGDGYDIRIIGGNGARQTVLGFASQSDAEAWVAQDKRLNDAADPFRPARFKPATAR